MKNILVIAGHPELSRSIGNKTILEELEKHYGDAIEIRRLCDLYPDYKIDIKAEQEALVRADVIVLQYPVFWYNVPALLKKWMDDVFQHGFSHGSKGKALHGKKFLLSFTTGADEKVYKEVLAHDIPDLMPPFMETAALCGMEWVDPVYSYGVKNHPLMGSDNESARKIGIDHAKRLIAVLEKIAK